MPCGVKTTNVSDRLAQADAMKVKDSFSHENKHAYRLRSNLSSNKNKMKTKRETVELINELLDKAILKGDEETDKRLQALHYQLTH